MIKIIQINYIDQLMQLSTNLQLTNLNFTSDIKFLLSNSNF